MKNHGMICLDAVNCPIYTRVCELCVVGWAGKWARATEREFSFTINQRKCDEIGVGKRVFCGCIGSEAFHSHNTIKLEQKGMLKYLFPM